MRWKLSGSCFLSVKEGLPSEFSEVEMTLAAFPNPPLVLMAVRLMVAPFFRPKLDDLIQFTLG